MPPKHEQCQEHSGLAEQVKMVCGEMRHNTQAVNDLCVEIRGLVVKSDQTEKDINNLGQLKADQTEVTALSKSFSVLRGIFYSTLVAGGFIGVAVLVIKSL